MMGSQLGHIILNTTASADEMKTKPDEDGQYGPIDQLLKKVAAELDPEDDK